jgi:hypothetical protein
VTHKGLLFQANTVEGVKQMHSEVIDALPKVTSRSSYWDFVPIGMDTEWEPFARSEAATPVAILQISTREKAYLLDMQALVRSVRRNRCERSGAQLASSVCECEIYLFMGF